MQAGTRRYLQANLRGSVGMFSGIRRFDCVILGGFLGEILEVNFVIIGKYSGS